MHRLLLAAPAFLLACSSPDGTTPAPDAGADAATTFSYTPAGCSYTVQLPEVRGFVGATLDDGQAITDTAGATPTRVRLGLGGASGDADPTTTAAFTWETPAQGSAARVKLGSSPSDLADVHAGYSWTTPAPTVGFGTGEPDTYMHEVHVCGLQPGTTYYYQVGGGAAGAEVWSATQSFTTVPSSGAITLGVSGDSRDDKNVYQLVQERMLDAGVSLQLFSGDFVLWGAQESLYGQWLDAAWKDPNDASKFLTLGQQMILPVPGNHENSSSQFYGNFALPGDGPYAESFASVDVGSAHIVLLDDQAIAEDPTGDAAKAQLAFLDADLGKAEQDRASRPFLIVVHHRGEFSTANHGSDADVIRTRDALVPIWDKHHVDLVLNGHDHNYERTKPITGPADAPVVQTSTTDGTTYVVCAGAGANGYAPGTAPAPYRAFNMGFGGGTPYVGVYSLVTLEAHKLTLKAYGLKASGGGVAGDDVIDQVELDR